MIERDPYDEDALNDIADRINRGHMRPETPADIEESARRIAAVIAEHPLRYRNVIEAVKACACVFEAILTGTMPGRVAVMSEEEAMAAAERFFDAIVSTLNADALQAITDDEFFDERYLAKTGSLGHRVFSMLR
jgi:uncharacterized protein (DUF849 family)